MFERCGALLGHSGAWLQELRCERSDQKLLLASNQISSKMLFYLPQHTLSGLNAEYLASEHFRAPRFEHWSRTGSLSSNLSPVSDLLQMIASSPTNHSSKPTRKVCRNANVPQYRCEQGFRIRLLSTPVCVECFFARTDCSVDSLCSLNRLSYARAVQHSVHVA